MAAAGVKAAAAFFAPDADLYRVIAPGL